MDSGHLIFKQCCSEPVVLHEAIYFSSNESVLLLPIETHSPSLVITLHLSHSRIAASLLEFFRMFFPEADGGRLCRPKHCEVQGQC